MVSLIKSGRVGIFSGSLLVFELELLSSRNSLVDLVDGLLLLPSAGEPPLAKKFPGRNGSGGALSTGGRGGASTLLSCRSGHKLYSIPSAFYI